MDLATLLSLAGAAFIFGISPGPGTLAALSVSTTQGLRSGLILGAGEAVGDVVYLTMAILSLGYLSIYLEPVMIFVRWIGAGYLIYLGVMQFRLSKLQLETRKQISNRIKLFLMGFLIGGTNPKVVLFYLSFIPLFLDLANVWGVDYNSSINDSSALRSATGIGVDWYTPIGPLSFSFAQPLSKKSSDKTETFRFNLGTTF